MTRYLILLLMLVGVCWPVAVTYYVGGASANALNPYFHESTVTAAQCIAADGAAIYTADDAAAGACSTADAGARTTITMAEGQTLPTIIAGTYAYIDFAASYTDGNYRINASDIGARTITIDCTYIDTSDVDAVRIGGAKPATAAVLTAITDKDTLDYNVAAGTATCLPWATNQVTVKVVGAAIDLDTSWTWDGRAGAAGYPALIYGCNSSWFPTVNACQLTCDSELANGLIFINQGATTDWYYVVYGFDLNGAGAGKAAYGVRTQTTYNSGWLFLNQITARSCTTDGFSIRGISSGVGALCPILTRCISYSNTDDGFEDNSASVLSHYNFCEAYSNGGDGFDLSAPDVVNRCISHHNTADGFNGANNTDRLIMTGCVAALNGSDGISIDAGAYFVSIIGNVAYDNTAYGFNLAGASPDITLFYMNLAYSNGSNELVNNVAYSTSAFVDAGLGSNVFDDPLFVDPDNATPGNSDYTLGTGSPAIMTLYSKWDIGSYHGASSGGSVSTGFQGGFDQ